MNYWDKQWTERCKEDGSVNMNMSKAERILETLWNRLHYFPLRKLEIGCGPGFHAHQMGRYSSQWQKTWFGIDESQVAINKAKSWGLSAIQESIYTFETTDRFGLFLFLDVLEHLDNHNKVAEKVRAFAEDKFYIFGNIPLYSSAHEDGYERPIGFPEIKKFVMNCGCKTLTNDIYGAFNFPYMMFEAEN